MLSQLVQLLYDSEWYVRHTLNAIFGGITVASIVGAIPAMSGLLSCLYFVVMIGGTPPGKKLIRAICTRCAAWWDV